MDFLLTTVVEQKDIFSMYDLYTYNTTAWESQGYGIREALRKSDIAAVAEGMFLTQYYNISVRMQQDSVPSSIMSKPDLLSTTTFWQYARSRALISQWRKDPPVTLIFIILHGVLCRRDGQDIQAKSISCGDRIRLKTLTKLSRRKNSLLS